MSKQPYRVRSRLLHWGAAALVLTTVILSGQFSNAPVEQAAAQIEGHVSFGLVLLALMLVRIWWRTRTVDPLDAYTLPTLQKAVARAVHYTLYALLVMQCLLGLLLALLGDGASVFGVFTIPPPGMATDPPAWLQALHAVLSNLLLGLIAIHAIAAVGHLIFGIVPADQASG